MKFADNMSVPLWKIKLLQNKQRKKEEEKRKEREAEEERLKKLPPWKRQAEQPKTVIIIDKNKTPNPVDLAELSKQKSSSSKSKSSSANAQPLVNGTAQSVTGGGGDETDSGAGGVSEEHCTPVQNNVFLTLERKKRKAPPPPKGGNQISVISSNVSVTHDPVTSANTSKKTLPTATGQTNSSKNSVPQSEHVKGNHIQQSKTLNGPSIVGNQTIISTKSNEDKKNLNEDSSKPKTGSASPAIKVSNIKVVGNSSASSPAKKSDNSATNLRTASSVSSSTPSSSKETPQQSRKDEETKSLGSVTQLGSGSASGDVPNKSRKKSISELTSIFDGKILSSSPSKAQPSNRIETQEKGKPQKISSEVKPQKSSNDVQPASSVSSANTKQSNSTSTNQKVLITNKQSVKNEDRLKPDENKKSTEVSTPKRDSKSLPAASVSSPSSPGRQKPSSDLPASAIISLTNAGPLKSREGQLVRTSSVIDDDEEVTLSLESHRSPENKRLSRSLGSPEKSASSAGTVNLSNGSPEKRKAPGTPQTAQLNGPTKTETKSAVTTKKEMASESHTIISNTTTKKVEEKEIEYPKNFRDPNYVPKIEESSKKEDIPYPTDFRKPVSSTSESVKTKDPIKPAASKATEDVKKEPSVQTLEKNLNSSVVKSSTEKKDTDKPKEPSPSKADAHIPYPDDFRKPKVQPTASNKPKDIKDIVKPSDLIKGSSSPSGEKKDNNDNNVNSGGIFGLQLRKTKKPETTGISVISQSNDSSKPKVDNSPKAPKSGLVAVGVGGGGGTAQGKKKTVVKKFEKVEMIGYNSPTGKPSALRKEDAKSTKKGLNVSFSSKEEETYEYMSEEAGIIYYDETHPEGGEEEEDGGKKSSSVTKVEENGMKNGSLDSSYDSEDDAESSLRSNAPIRSSGGFQNLAAANLSAMDMLLGRGPRPAEPSEPSKPTLTPEQEPEPEDMSFRPMDGDLFSSTGHSTAALLF